MTPLAPLLLAVLVAMTPAARDAFSQVAGAEIIAGHMEMSEPLTAEITALGRKDGVLMQIKCRWFRGVPLYISYQVLGGET